MLSQGVRCFTALPGLPVIPRCDITADSHGGLSSPGIPPLLCSRGQAQASSTRGLAFHRHRQDQTSMAPRTRRACRSSASQRSAARTRRSPGSPGGRPAASSTGAGPCSTSPPAVGAACQSCRMPREGNWHGGLCCRLGIGVPTLQVLIPAGSASPRNQEAVKTSPSAAMVMMQSRTRLQ